MNEDLVTVARFTEPTRANIALQALEGAGIEGYLLNEATSIIVYWPVPVELQVATSDVEAARRALGLEPGRKATAPGACIHCGAGDVQAAPPGLLGFFYLLLCIAIVFPPRLKPAWSCKQCGHWWRQEPMQGVPAAQP
jgi:hypothetical protein